PRARDLWWRLGEVYRARLGDIESARTAYEIAAKLAPKDVRPREALARLLAQNRASWNEAGRVLRESWQLDPDDVGPGLWLFARPLEGERWDAAFVTAAALDSRNPGGSTDAADFVRRYRPRFLVRAQSPLAPELVAKLRHPDEDPLLNELFAYVFAAHAS